MFKKLTTVTFSEENGKTKQILRARVIKKRPKPPRTSRGWKRAGRKA